MPRLGRRPSRRSAPLTLVVALLGGQACGLVTDFDPAEVRLARRDAGLSDSGAVDAAMESSATTDGALADSPIDALSDAGDARADGVVDSGVDAPFDARATDGDDGNVDGAPDVVASIDGATADVTTVDVVSIDAAPSGDSSRSDGPAAFDASGEGGMDVTASDAPWNDVANDGDAIGPADGPGLFPLPTRLWPPNGTQVDPFVPNPITFAWFGSTTMLTLEIQPVDGSCPAGYSSCPFTAMSTVLLTLAGGSAETSLDRTLFATAFPNPGHYAWRLCAGGAGTTPCTPPRYFVSGRTRTDLDNDGHGSLIYQDIGSTEIVEYDAVTGTTSLIYRRPTVPSVPELLMDDVTGDELPEILLGRPFDEMFTSGVALRITDRRDRYWCIGDIDADEIPDLAYATPLTGDISVAFGGSMPALSRTRFLGPATFDAAWPAGDFDGDGLLDLVLSTTGSGTLTFIPGSPGGPRLPVSLGFVPSAVIALGDVDRPRDGYGDVAVVGTRFGTAAIDVIRGPFGVTGTASVEIRTAAGCSPAPATRLFAVGGFDADSDGEIDVLVGSTTGSAIYRYSPHPGAPAPDCIDGNDTYTGLVPVGRGLHVLGTDHVLVASVSTAGTKRLFSIGGLPLSTSVPSSAVLVSAY